MRKLEILLIAFIIKILGCLENFSNIESIGSLKFSPSFMLLLGSFIPRDDAAWPKYVFNISATSVSSTINFLFPSIKLILFLDMPLSVKNGFIVPQNFIVSVMTFMSILL